MKIIFVLLYAALIIGCSNISGDHSIIHNTTIVKNSIKVGRPLSPNEWHCFNIENDKICIPEKWGYLKQDSFYFVSNLTKIEPHSFFAVVKQKKNLTKLNSIKYIKGLYNYLKNDSPELLTGYQAIQVIYADKQVIYSEFYTSLKNTNYIEYSTVFEINNDLYDITLKVGKNKSKIYNQIYTDITYNFYNNNIKIFDAKDKIIGAKILELDKL